MIHIWDGGCRDACHLHREQVVVISATKLVDMSLPRLYYGSFRSNYGHKKAMYGHTTTTTTIQQRGNKDAG
eukprot:scaffold5874_cov153-Skeletonema_dohrnii-CCMP3373.AAC.3